MTDHRLSGLAARLADRAQLVERIDASASVTDPDVSAVRYDSRVVAAGDLFVARPGQHADGHDHAAAAVAAGAVAVVAERSVEGVGVPQLIVRDAKTALAVAASWRLDDPSQQLGVVGITGTDGKTTTAYLVRAILEATGERTGLIGTTEVIVGGRSLDNAARTTTPEAPELQGHLAGMLASGDTFVVLESTSHGLAQQRVGSVAYDVAVLTNLTSEHLEFHGSLEAYRAAKRILFERLALGPDNPAKGLGKHAIVNADDAHAATFEAAAREAGADVLRYGIGPALRPEGADGGPADLVATRYQESPSELLVDVTSGDWQGLVRLRLAGRFNIHNALAALGVARALGVDMDVASGALAGLEAVPGRMQRIDAGQPFSVVVDYAHTAASLEKVLDELAPVVGTGGLIAVFGSAGDRDTRKRGPMGRVAGARCRVVVVTDEDPRSEDRMAILEAIAAGAQSAGRRRGEDLLVIADRAEAIDVAIAAARPGDVVLLAGKGHERTIETADGPQPWDEAAAALDALGRLGFHARPASA